MKNLSSKNELKHFNWFLYFEKDVIVLKEKVISWIQGK